MDAEADPIYTEINSEDCTALHENRLIPIEVEHNESEYEGENYPLMEIETTAGEDEHESNHTDIEQYGGGHEGTVRVISKNKSVKLRMS